MEVPYGRSEPGASIIISENGIYLGKAYTSQDGYWTFTPPKPLPDGSHTIKITVTDEAGNSSKQSAGYKITVVSKPTITSIIDDVGETTGIIPNGGTTDDLRPTLYGTASPGAKVHILSIDNDPSTSTEYIYYGYVFADQHGNWTHTVEVDLKYKKNEFFAYTNGPSGIPLTSDIWTINIKTSFPALAAQETLEDSQIGALEASELVKYKTLHNDEVKTFDSTAKETNASENAEIHLSSMRTMKSAPQPDKLTENTPTLMSNKEELPTSNDQPPASLPAAVPEKLEKFEFSVHDLLEDAGESLYSNEENAVDIENTPLNLNDLISLEEEPENTPEIIVKTSVTDTPQLSIANSDVIQSIPEIETY